MTSGISTLSLAGFLLLALLPSTASAQNLVAKADVNTTVLLNSPTAWVDSAVPGSGDIALFDSTMATASNVLNVIGGDLSLRGIKVVDPKTLNLTSGYRISASTNGLTNEDFAYTGTLSLGASGLDLSQAVALPNHTNNFFTIGCPVALTANQTWNVPKLSATLPRDLNLSGSTVTGGFRRTMDVDFNGHTVTKTGTGTVAIFADCRALDGTLDVQGGTVTFTNSISASTSTSVMQDVPSSLTVKASPGGTVNIAQAPGGGDIFWDAALVLQGGTLAISKGNYTGRTELDGTLIAASGTTSTILYDNAATTSTPITPTLYCPLAGSGDIDIQMTSPRTQDWLELTGGDSTFTGHVTVSAGRVRVVNATGSATGTGTLTVAAGATLAGYGVTGPLTVRGTYRVAIDADSVYAVTSQGPLHLDGATLYVAPEGWGITESSYVIAEATAITGSFATIPHGYEVSVVNGGIGKQLVLTVIPDDAFDVCMDGFPGVNAELAGPDDDADRDGLANSVEFVLDGNPTSNVQTHLPAAAATGSGLTFTFTRRKDAAEAGYQSLVEWSTTLAGNSWTSVAPTVVTSTETTETVQAVISAPPGSVQLFARLKVTKAE